MNNARYLLTKGQRQAAEMATMLGMPLLVTGEPGIGKSTLAKALAQEQNLQKPFRVQVHSDTRYRDLFYTIDEIGRFSEANIRENEAVPKRVDLDLNFDTAKLSRTDPRLFVRFRGLGAGILQAMQLRPEWLQPALQGADILAGAQRSVVLIDEIDKAPRDVPNDLLNQLDDWCFEVREFARVEGYGASGFALGATDIKPLVVITSNEEQALPDAFMRRCVYLNLELPKARSAQTHETEITLEDIVIARLADDKMQSEEALVAQSIAAFTEMRTVAQDAKIRKPGLAELLNGVHCLAAQPALLQGADRPALQQLIASLWLKGKSRQLLQQHFEEQDFPQLAAWLNPAP